MEALLDELKIHGNTLDNPARLSNIADPVNLLDAVNL